MPQENKGLNTPNRRMVNDANDEKFVTQQEWKDNKDMYEAEGWRREDAASTDVAEDDVVVTPPNPPE